MAHIYIYAVIEACAQSGADTYIYIYNIYIYICLCLNLWHERLNLARTAQYGYRKLWYITLSFHIYDNILYIYSQQSCIYGYIWSCIPIYTVYTHPKWCAK